MNKLLLATLLTALSVPAFGRDDRHLFPVKEALETPAADSKLDKQVKLFFGNQSHPRTEQTLGEWRTNKKTNAFNKSDKEACEWTFLSAVLELQARARKEGGDAVINIKSNYKDREHTSDTEYECGAGALMAGVALKGTVVKLAK